MVFILLRFEGRSYKEIACRMMLSETMVRKYAVRALQHCRARLDGAGTGRTDIAQGAKWPGSIVNRLNDPDSKRQR